MTLAFDSLASDSPLARLDARWRLAALVPPIIAAGALQHPVTLAIAFALSVGLLASAPQGPEIDAGGRRAAA